MLAATAVLYNELVRRESLKPDDTPPDAGDGVDAAKLVPGADTGVEYATRRFTVGENGDGLAEAILLAELGVDG